MPFNQETGKIAGKKSSRKGVPNKSTAEIRECFKQIILENLNQLRKDIDSLEPIHRIKVLLELSRYIIPRLNTVTFKEEEEESGQIDYNLLSDKELDFLIKIKKKYTITN